jgi:two-component sensor histidine kinase
MLRFQEFQTLDPAARHSLADAGARVLALSKAHEAMAVGSPEAMLDAQAHVERLARTLFAAQAPPPPQAALALELDVAPVGLLPEQMVPCSIFLAEGLTNAIKHAFPGGRGGVIRISLRAEGGMAELRIEDDGIGFGGDPAELGRNSFGLQCLQAAAEHLEGTVSLGVGLGRGACACVRFPLADYQSRSA